MSRFGGAQPITREDDKRQAHVRRAKRWIETFVTEDLETDTITVGEYELLKQAADLKLEIDGMTRKERLSGKGREMAKDLAGLILNLRRGRGKR
jgi:hypothetical protein